MRNLIGLMLSLVLFGCSTRDGLAPVFDSGWSYPHPGVHVVRRGETLYAIAFRHDMDYRQLAVMNGLKPPYIVYVGQTIHLNRRLIHPKQVVPARGVRRSLVRTPVHRPSVFSSRTRAGWVWPASGRIAATFSPENGRKGIDIAGHKGQRIVAVASGVVAYAGGGLAGYGNLIIIRHGGQLLTAYGNNLRNTVHEGQRVAAGQVIAEMGLINRQFWGVHFEVREAGQPMNPLRYLRTH